MRPPRVAGKPLRWSKLHLWMQNTHFDVRRDRHRHRSAELYSLIPVRCWHAEVDALLSEHDRTFGAVAKRFGAAFRSESKDSHVLRCNKPAFQWQPDGAARVSASHPMSWGIECLPARSIRPGTSTLRDCEISMRRKIRLSNYLSVRRDVLRIIPRCRRDKSREQERSAANQTAGV
jgi:hypothetical protein